jgi:periplasmic protein TonB
MNAAFATPLAVPLDRAGLVSGRRATGRSPHASRGRGVSAADLAANDSGVASSGLRAAEAWSGSGTQQRRPLMGGLVLGLHLLLLVGLWQGLARDAMPRPKLLIPVHWVSPADARLEKPAKPLPPLATVHPELTAPAVTMLDPPVLAVATEPAPTLVAAALPTPTPAVAPAEQAPAPVVQQVAPPAAPAIKRLPASAVRWLKEPRMTVPLLSKRLRESGIVHVRVVVDVNGLPREVSLAKSSGFSRLDEQALQDIRTARFVPYAENGQPIEWEVIAPMSYEVDR